MELQCPNEDPTSGAPEVVGQLEANYPIAPEGYVPWKDAINAWNTWNATRIFLKESQAAKIKDLGIAG